MSQPEAIYHDERLARAYDELNPWGGWDDLYRAMALESGGPVLDIGCGTGTFACRLAAEDGLEVTGLDQAAAMLKVARAKPEADRVTWVEADARDFDLGRRFAFIVMTGHAFQALPGETAMAEALAAAARHLAPGGRFAFESRNPAAREWLEWTPERTRVRIAESRCGLVENWHDATGDEASGIVALTTWFRFVDPPVLTSGDSTLRFPTQARIAGLIADAGLAVERWLGWWDGSPYRDDSREIIAVTRRATT